MKTLDLRNMPCPQPVVACRSYLMTVEESSTKSTDNHAKSIPSSFPKEGVHILVDNDAAAENVRRFWEQKGFSVECEAQENNFSLIVQRGDSAQNVDLQAENEITVRKNISADVREHTLVFITTETLGRGDDELGSKLMTTFLSTLPELGDELWRLILLNGGAKLAAQQGPSLEHLKALEASGVSVLVCGTCLAHYGLMQEKQVGETSNMLDIVTSLQLAGKVIRP